MSKKNKVMFGMLAVILLVSIAITVGILQLSKNETQQKDLTVVASFYPVYIAAENVIGDTTAITLENLSEPQTGCLHDFQLTTGDMKLISQADLFLVNGGGIETFLTDVAKEYPKLTIVETSRDVSLLSDEEEENAHAWMSVADYRVQVAAIAEALEELDPTNAELYKKNALEYDGKLAKLEEQQQEIRQAAEGENVILFHEAYAYVAKDYGWNVSYVLDLDEERQVSAGEVADVLNAIKENHVSYILAEEKYGSDMGKTVEAESDAKVIYLDTCNRGDYNKDSYINAMQDNIDKLKEAFCK